MSLEDGLAVLRAAAAERYPDAAPDLPPRSRGVIALFEENCTVCMLCARECPAWCIHLESHKEPVPPTHEGGRPRSRNVLDRFAIDFALCLYCGICVEVCPFDALFWSPEFAYSAADAGRPRARAGPAAGVDVDGAGPAALRRGGGTGAGGAGG